jgi:hypothetical protein
MPNWNEYKQAIASKNIVTVTTGIHPIQGVMSDEVAALAQAIAQSDAQDVARLMLMLAQEVTELSGYIRDMDTEPDGEAWADYEPSMDKRAYADERGIPYDPELDGE